MSIEKRLAQGLRQLAVETDQAKLAEYLNLLNKWNKAYNLTAIRRIEEMVDKHIIDSLSIAPYLHGQNILDVGTGAGLPGIPLAITFPGKNFVLLDSNGKKTRFLTEAKRQLRLDNIEIVQSRVENYHFEAGFDTVTSRAFASLEQMIAWTEHLINARGIWLAMKGKKPQQELQMIQYTHQTVDIQLPGSEDSRCIVIIKKTED